MWTRVPQKKTERERGSLATERGEREKGSLRSGFKGGERKLIWIFLEVPFWYGVVFINLKSPAFYMYVYMCIYCHLCTIPLFYFIAFEIEPALLFHWQICRLISCFSPNGFDFLKCQLKCHWFLCIFSIKFLKANNLRNNRSLIFSSGFLNNCLKYRAGCKYELFTINCSR